MPTVVLPPELEHAVPPSRASAVRRQGMLVYLAVGVFCGVILIKSEIASWYRIQEMLRFQGFHMFGFFAFAVATAAVSLLLLKRARVRVFSGGEVCLAPKQWARGWRYVLGSILFGLGWGLLNACPGPIYALLGSGVTVMLVALASALAGTWVYGWLRPHLPH